jgi:phospholipid/cholesterol/gamma-HCH transport system permease protein
MTMQAAFDLSEESGAPVLALRGDWTVNAVKDVDAPLRALGTLAPATLDVSALGRMDVAGAWLVTRTLGGAPRAFRGDHATASRLLDVTRAGSSGEHAREEQLTGLYAIYDRIGRSVVNIAQESVATVDFLGRSVVSMGRLIARPSRIRWVSIFSVMESAGVNAAPIVMLLSFFVGVVVAFLGSRILGDFGASVFTVELVAFSVLREFGIVIAAVLLAGRTDSAFTAQIGAMKMRQEIDAMRVLGLDPMEAIVAPRLIAMLVMVPVLAFAATMAGLLGGLIVCWSMLNISPAMFITRIQDGVPIQHFWVGMVKAPVIAVVLALVGCRHGLETGVDVTSLGKRVTASVVQAIFLVIVLDALFAVWFLEMDW